jgi:hypothetical protein
MQAKHYFEHETRNDEDANEPEHDLSQSCEAKDLAKQKRTIV